MILAVFTCCSAANAVLLCTLSVIVSIAELLFIALLLFLVFSPI